jgi:signal peptidase I
MHADGDYVVIDKLSTRFLTPERGEAVVLRHPRNPRVRLLKRVVGLPGDTVTIEEGMLRVESPGRTGMLEIGEARATVGGEESLRRTLASGEIFVLGDRRSASVDSRAFGPVPFASIEGRVILRLGTLPRFLRW